MTDRCSDRCVNVEGMALAKLISILTFTNVGPGAQATLAHGLNLGNGQNVRPDLLLRDNGNFSIINTTTTQVTVQNNDVAPATLNLWCQHEHSIPRVLGGGVANLSPQPFVPAAGTAGGGGSTIDVEDEGVPIGTFTTLNFTGAGVTASDSGGGVSAVTIPGGGGGGVSGSGTPNTLPIWTAPTVLGDAPLVVVPRVSEPGDQLVLAADLVVDGSITRLSTLSPAALPSGITNDYNPDDLIKYGVVRITTDIANSALGGLVVPLDIRDNTEWVFVNLGPGTLTFLNDEGTEATPSRRFSLEDGVSRVVGVGGNVLVRRDSITDRWYVLG